MSGELEHAEHADPAAPIAGLTAKEAARRLLRDGPNELPVARPVPAWRHLLKQMVSFFALMLWVAGALAFVAGMPQLGVAIFAVIVINGAFAFLQEHRAERAADELRDLLPRRATVIRDGITVEVEAEQLVVDDVLVLGAGDRLSADAELTRARSLRVDTSAITGESVPEDVGVPDHVLAGSFVVEGEGLALVRATGHRTRLAAIARLTETGRRPHTPLAKELARVVRLVAVTAIAVGAAFFGVAALVGTGVSDSFLLAIGVTVALVPEGLLPTVTLSLAAGAQRMADRQALVRRLEAVETLGSTTFICTDKTGTLTRNEMEVVAAWTPSGSATILGTGYEPTAAIDADPAVLPTVGRLARAARLCSSGRIELSGDRWVARGDPMEAALDTFAQRLDAARDEPIAFRFPFDTRRRRMSAVVAGELLVKGAPESVLPRSRTGADAEGAVRELAGRGLRVIAVAVGAPPPAPDADADAVETDLELLGLIGLEDPPRAEAREALAACRRAGIRVAMITGDHPATAAAVAHQVGLSLPAVPVVDGTALPGDDDVLGALLDHDGVVVSRVSPEDKLRVARALQARGHVVAMTGDGVNDGPALQEADIGVAMGRSGTDVAREAADLVLLDDNFATIVSAIEHGRATFANIRRFLTYHLTDNVAELTPFVVWALSGGRIPLALGVLQILALDIGTDLLPALALGAEQPRPGVLDRPPERGHLLDRKVFGRAFGVLGPAEALVEMAAFFAVFLAAGWVPGELFPEGATLLAASGAAFAAVVLGQAANAFACRSEHQWAGALRWTGNRLLLVAVGVELVALLAFVGFPPLADLLGQSWPTPAGWLVAFGAIPAVIGADAGAKWWAARGRERIR
jgi:magnesium-transporting ATPase (P-type)